MRIDYRFATEKQKANRKAKQKYFLKHSTSVNYGHTRLRVANSVIVRVNLHHKNGLSTAKISKKMKKPLHLVKAVKSTFYFARKPIMELDLILPKQVFQQYNKYGIVNCRCGKFYPEDSNHYCAPTINNP